MRASHILSLFVLLPLAACNGGVASDGSGGAGGSSSRTASSGDTTTTATTGTGTDPSTTSAGPTGGGTTSSATGGGTTSTAAGGGPLTCDSVDQGVGCCDASGVLHYCDNNGNVVDQACSSTKACGWSAANGYYDCVNPPASADPSGTYPLACGGGGSTSSSSTTSSSSSSTTGGGGGVTWTELYTNIFGPTGTSHCTGSGCHTNTQSGFKCGTSKATCYTGMVNAGLVAPGANASSSVLVNPNTSPLCGSLGGKMPKGGTCVTSAQIADIKSWLATGAPNN